MASKIPVRYYDQGSSEKSVASKKLHVLTSLVEAVDDVKREVLTDQDTVGVAPKSYRYKRKNIKKSMPVYNTSSDQKKIKQLWVGVFVLMFCIVLIWFFVLYKSKFFTLDSYGAENLIMPGQSLGGESIKESYDELTQSIDVLREQFEVESVNESSGDMDGLVESNVGSKTILNNSVNESVPADSNTPVYNDSSVPDATLRLPKKGLIIQ